MVPRILVMINGGRTCQPCRVSSGRSTVYSSSIFVMTSKGNRLLQCLNSCMQNRCNSNDFLV